MLLLSISKNLQQTPRILKSLVSFLPKERLDERLQEDRFTVREEIAHLNDLESVFQHRLSRLKSESGWMVESLNLDMMALEGAYEKADIGFQIKEFASKRESLLTLFSEFEEASRTHFFVHPTFGHLTAESYLGLVASHDLYHLGHICEIL